MQFMESGKSIDLDIEHVVVAGWTGRNTDAVDHHIQELAALGIAPPSTVPLFYRISNSLLCQETRIEVLGEGTSGEVEPLLVRQDGRLWLGLASDHTDRDLEAYSVAASKQACPKPVSRDLWTYDSVKEHLDSLILRCSIRESERWVVYQEGELANISPLSDLIEAAELADNGAMLCGTLAAIGGVRPATEYAMELVDPLLNKRIQLTYSVATLPVIA